jgi:polyisoprenoid-binding protein YceI
MKWRKSERRGVHAMVLCVSALVLFVPVSRGQAPVFEIASKDSRIRFHVKSSITIAGKFDKWDESLKFQSSDETTGSLELKIDAASVDTGRGMKNSRLKSKDFFEAAQNHYIAFQSTKVVPTGIHTYEVDGDLTIRGVKTPRS